MRLIFDLLVVTVNKPDGTSFTFSVTRKEKLALARAALFGGNPDPRPKKRVGVIHYISWSKYTDNDSEGSCAARQGRGP
jgi:hypothetical protein